MKIIRVIALEPVLDIDFHPDSALLLQGRPLFMPEDGDGWQGELSLAVKISRLGKNISTKFASRYYDGVTSALRLVIPSKPELEPVVAGMDSSIVHGIWLDPAKASGPMTVGAGGVSVGLAPQSSVIDSAISLVSRHTTLKMGDVLLLPIADGPVALSAPGRLAMTVDGEEVLDLKLV